MEEEKENNCWNCWGYYAALANYCEEKKKKIAGRLGIILSILNIIFIIIDNVMPTAIVKYVVASLISAGVFIGGIMFERIVSENEVLEEDNKSKQEIIRRFTVMPVNAIDMTPQSIDSVEPINFEQMHHNNIIQTSMNNYAFPNN